MNSNKKQLFAILVVLLVGALLAALILTVSPNKPSADEHGHGEESHAAEGGKSTKEHQSDAAGVAENGAHDEGEGAAGQKGPHGGRLFSQDGYALEVTIFEQGVEPEFRLYTYQNGKPLDPAASNVTLTLERLGGAPQRFAFTRENGYLKSQTVVEEPHSFNVKIVAQHDDKSYRFAYEQVEARVMMSDAQVQKSGIGVATAGPARIRSTFNLIGEVHYNEDRMVHVVPRLGGTVEAVKVSAGDRVRKGQVMAIISSQALADQRSELLAAQQRFTLAQTTYERERKLWQEKISAEQDYLQARKEMQEARIVLQSARQKLASIGGSLSGDALTRYEVRAPIDGTITAKRIAVGQAVKDDTDIFVVADLSTVWVEMTVPAKALNVVQRGQKVVVKAVPFDASATGSISYVGAVVGEQARNATARAVLPNPEGTWRPGLPVNIELTAQEVEVPVAVAAEGIQSIGDEPVVFGRYGDAFEARPLKLGRNDGRFAEVLDGLKAGENYAADNSFLLKADLGKAGASHEH